MLMAIVFGLAYMLVFSPWITNDANTHIPYCISLANKIMGYDENYATKSEAVGMEELIRQKSGGEDGYLIFPQQERGDYERTKEYFEWFSSDEGASTIPYDVSFMSFYGAINYVPLLLAIIISRAANLGFIPMLYLSRLMALAAYTYLSYRAIRRTPLAKYAFALFALLPMNLISLGAFTYDNALVVVALNFIASFFLFEQDRTSTKNLIELFIWSFLLGGVKGGSLLLFALLLFTLIRSREDKTDIIKAVALFATCVLSTLLFDVILNQGGFFQFGDSSSERLTTSFMWEHPLKYLMLWISTMKENGLVYYMQMFGTNPTNNEFLTVMVLPSFLLSLILPVCAVADRTNMNLIKKQHIVMILIINAIFMYIVPSSVLRETYPTDPYIVGVQRRYFLPALPMMYICFARIVKVELSPKVTSRIKSASIILFGIINSTIIYLLLNTYLMR